MEDRTCLKCTRPLFSQGRDLAFERACCRAPFHRQCIENAEMRRCPSCKRNTESLESTFVWNPVHRGPKHPVEDEESAGEPKAKRQKRDQTFKCSICLEEGTSEDELLTTDCCNQRAHVSCLRLYYKLPCTSRSENHRDQIARNLGLPNCFVCRMDERGMRPLTRSVLNAILPSVRDTWWWRPGRDANRAMISFGAKSARLVQDWLRPWKYMLALEKSTVAVRFADGSEKRLGIRTFGAVSARKARTTIRKALTAMSPQWAATSRSDDQTSTEVRVYKITEMALTLTLSNYRKVARRSTGPNARPFQLDRSVERLSTWTCHGRYFDLDDPGNAGTDARASCHLYERRGDPRHR